MTDTDHAHLRTLAEKATRGPWRWTDRRVPDLVGRGGDPDVYEYEIEVIDAEHYGECGCRSACELNLNVGPFDAEFIAAADPQTVLALLDEIERLRGEAGEGPWEYGEDIGYKRRNIVPRDVACISWGTVYRRRKAGPWERVPEGEGDD